jgi:pyruvate kinase
MRRTKIVCTIGPASSAPDVLDRLVAAGMDVARLNFSHGTQAEHARVIQAIREGEGRWGRPITILQDLQGPKVRLGTFEGGQAMLPSGGRFVLTGRAVKGTAERSSLNHPEFLAALRPGDAVWMNDGMIQLVVEKVADGEVHCRVISGGLVSDHKGVSFPRLPVPVSCLTPKDRGDLRFGIEQGVDYLAVSFVRSAADIQEVRKFLHDQGANLPIVAKLERAEIVANLQGVLPLVDAVMVARGDLGVEVPLEEVPIIQKEVIRQARQGKVPVIVATQMLESMVEHTRPTRAEVSDVATAIFDGADAIMLSAETATGRFPIETRSGPSGPRRWDPRRARGPKPTAFRKRSRTRRARRPSCSTRRPSWPSPSPASARGSSPRTGPRCRSSR